MASPESVGMNEGRLAEIDDVVAGGIATGEMPGCVVAVGRRGKIAFLKAFGHRQIEPAKVAMTTDTLFDLASLTKPIATATSLMVLRDDGKLGLCEPVARYLPEFAANGKESTTVFELLTHQGGLVADNSLADYRHGPAEAWRRIFALEPRYAPGSKFVYSDVGFLVLGRLVSRLSGQGLDEFSRDRIFRPLGMTETGFLPPEMLRRRAAATQRRDDRWMTGEVHDPRAHLLGGVAGHAGLFSKAEDLAVYAQMMLGGGEYGGARILEPDTVAMMTRGYRVTGGFRGLGWDSLSGYSSNRGSQFSARAFGHGGFTGTALWVDPDRELFVIFLSSRLHPDGRGSVNQLAGRIGTIAAEAIEDYHSPEVLTGLDVLVRDGFRQLAGRRVGLITNHTGIDRQGTSAVRLLAEADAVRLVSLFSPEHGLEGKLDVPNIDDGSHSESKLPVWSLYGKTRRPTPQMLEGVDTLVFDIQDIGTRFYTYISTMGLAMEAAAEAGVRFVVLDRPNPIGGLAVDGPVLDAGSESFTAHHRLPIRHGMTVGELALMFKDERGLDLDLDVIRVQGWRRGDLFDATGLRWVNPSPNMRSLTEAILYPGVGLLETTNLSVGRGTDTPFEIVGATWIDGQQLERALSDAKLPGVAFGSVRFTPNASRFRDERCGGITVAITDRGTFDPLATGLEIARQLGILFPDDWSAKDYNRLLGSQEVLDAVLAGKTVDEIKQIYRPGLDDFLARRRQFLIYEP